MTATHPTLNKPVECYPKEEKNIKLIFTEILPKKSVIITDLSLSHNFDWENVDILDTETSYYKRLISETLHIKNQTTGKSNG